MVFIIFSSCFFDCGFREKAQCDQFMTNQQKLGKQMESLMHVNENLLQSLDPSNHLHPRRNNSPHEFEVEEELVDDENMINSSKQNDQYLTPSTTTYPSLLSISECLY